MSNELSADQNLSVALAKLVLDGVESKKEDARLSDELVSTLGEHVTNLMPEDQRRFAEQIRVFPKFMAACQALDRACADGDRAEAERQKAEMKRLSEKSKRAMKYSGLTDAAEALAKATDFAEFCALLPSVPLDRTYGSGFRGVSPFPLLWAISARSRPIERVELMLDAGAGTDLSTRLGETVLHAMARMNRRGRARLSILKMLISAGADIHAQTLHGVTPLAAALDEGSKEDITNFIAAGAKVGMIELRFATEDPARLQLMLDHIADDQRLPVILAEYRDWLAEEIERAQQHYREAVAQRIGARRLAVRVEQLGISFELINRLRSSVL